MALRAVSDSARLGEPCYLGCGLNASGPGWTDKNDRWENGLAEKLMAERCSLEAEAISYFSATNLSALQKEIRMNSQLSRCSRFVSPGPGTRGGPVRPRYVQRIATMYLSKIKSAISS
jgi:hypothetical protein